jgi:uncharacterized membrane protein (UPF0182 family)
MFKVQRNLLTKFHVTDPHAFFSGQDFWQVPNAPDNPQSNVRQPPYYLNIQLPQQTGTTFQLTAAVTPYNRENLAALISGYYDAGDNPHLQITEVPDQTVTPGPVQVHQKMTNNTAVRTELLGLLSNSSQSQVQVLYGNLITLPVDNGILYVEPVYVKAGNQDTAAPLLQKVLMSYGDGGTYVVLANNLQDGLTALSKLGGANPPSSGSGTTTPTQPNAPPANLSGQLADAAAKVDQAIDNVRTAQKSGDFAKYGQALQALDQAMSDFQNAQKAAGQPATGPTVTPSGSAPATPSAPASGTPSPTPSG